MNPVLIRLFDDKQRESPKVDWENCTAAGLDNTMVNVGKKNSIRTRVLAKNKNIFINGCTCHIIQNTANKAAERFSRSVRF